MFHPRKSERALRRLDPGWTKLKPPPLTRARAVSIWIDGALFYWGGDSQYGDAVHSEGAIYNPARDRWYRIPEPPIPGRTSPAAVWTGREVIIQGGSGYEGSQRASLGDGAAFDPLECQWRTIPKAPFSARDPLAAVWTGDVALFWGRTARPNGKTDGAAYDPKRDAWRAIADAPISFNAGDGIWTGEEMIVFGSELNNNNNSRTNTPIGAAYNPATNQWRKLPSVQMSPQASAIAWTGDEMIAWDYELTAYAYEPQADQWRDINDVPLEFSECYPSTAATREHLLAYFCGASAVLNLQTETWSEVKTPLLYGRPVAAGSVFLLAGAAHESLRNRLMVFNPET